MPNDSIPLAKQTPNLSAPWKHATQWQIAFGGVVTVTLVASQVLDNYWLITANGIVMLIAFSWLVSWSVIWCVLGDGRLWRNVLSFVAVHHISILLGIFCPFVLFRIGLVGTGLPDQADLIMMFTGMAYVSTAELFVMMGIIAGTAAKKHSLAIAKSQSQPSQRAV